MSFSLFSKIDGEAAALVPILNEYNILQIVVCFIAFVSFTILNPSSLAWSTTYKNTFVVKRQLQSHTCINY